MLVACADAVPVVDDGGRLLGLVTARHCVELVAHRCIGQAGTRTISRISFR
jgi:CBS domain-containing protein